MVLVLVLAMLAGLSPAQAGEPGARLAADTTTHETDTTHKTNTTHTTHTTNTTHETDTTHSTGSVATVAAVEKSLQTRIFNGEPASIGDLPSVVYIANLTTMGSCTGTVIADRWVLTAAHCFDAPFSETTANAPEMLVLGGRDTWSNNAADWPAVHDVDRGLHHPSWNPQGAAAAHDIALLRLATPTSIPPMAMTAAGRPDHVGQQATVAGWGITSNDPFIDSDVLRRALVDVRPHENCESEWGWQYDRNWLVCAGGGPSFSDACEGDSGGPLLLESGGTQTLIGVVNAGDLCTSQSLQNGIYTGVAAYRSWIDQTAGTTGSTGPDPGEPDDPADPTDPGAPDGPTPPGDPDDLQLPDGVDIGTGDVQVTLLWTGGEDLDLYVVDPTGEQISWQNPASASGGRLDRDEVPACGDTTTSVENIFWPVSSAPPGSYEAWFEVFRSCAEPSTFRLEIRVDGVLVDEVSGTTGFERLASRPFTYDDALPAPPDDGTEPIEVVDPSPLPAPIFLDVPTDFVHAPGINAVAAAGITTGCTADRYCPRDPVTRAQMATFLTRSLALDDPGGASFLDVAADSVHAPGIRAVAAAGITAGCTADRYCPGEAVTRAQMATFLDRAVLQGGAGDPADTDPDEPLLAGPRITTDTLPPVQRGLSYATVLEAEGGQAPHRFAVSGLPDGLAVSEDGRLSGLLLEEGTWPLTVTVTDIDGEQAEAQLELVAEDAGVPQACLGQECALLEPFDGTPVEVEGDTVAWQTFELEVGKTVSVEVEDFRLDPEGQPQGSAQLSITGIEVAPQVGDVLVVPEEDHPEGHPGVLIVRAEQVAEQVTVDGTVAVTVSGPLVGLMDAYVSGVVHIRDAEPVLLDDDGQPLTEAQATARNAPVRCEREGEESVTVTFTPSMDGDVYVAWEWGVPRQVEISAEVGMALTTRVALSGEIQCEVAEIPTLRVAKGPVIFGLGTKVDFGGNAAFDGSMSASMSCDTTFGYNRGAPAHFGCAAGQVDLALATGEDVNQAQASLTAALTPSITMAQVVGVSGSLGTTFRAHLTPFDNPQARLDVEIPTMLEGCIGCDLPWVGTLREATFINETYGPRTVWSRDLYAPPDPSDPDELPDADDPSDGDDGAGGDEGDAGDADPSLDELGWPTHRSDGTNAFYAYLGAMLLFPSWVSCSDVFCLVGSGGDLHVFVVESGIEHLGAVPIADDPRPPAEILRELGFPEDEIRVLLA